MLFSLSLCINYTDMDADESFYSAIELLKRMISIPSFSRDENNVATEIERYAQNVLNLFPRRYGNNLCFHINSLPIKIL